MSTNSSSGEWFTTRREMTLLLNSLPSPSSPSLLPHWYLLHDESDEVAVVDMDLEVVLVLRCRASTSSSKLISSFWFGGGDRVQWSTKLISSKHIWLIANFSSDIHAVSISPFSNTTTGKETIVSIKAAANKSNSVRHILIRACVRPKALKWCFTFRLSLWMESKYLTIRFNMDERVRLCDFGKGLNSS